MKQIRAWLIYRASDATLRVSVRPPRYLVNEAVWQVTLNVPEPWGAVGSRAEVSLPDSLPSEIKVTAIAVPRKVV